MPVLTAFERAIQSIVPGASHARLARDLFGNRVTRIAVAGWRTGRRKPPDWAIEALRLEAYRQHKARQQALQAIPSRDPPVAAGLRAIAALRARRAKEKGLATEALVESESGKRD